MKYQVTQESGATQEIICLAYEWDWKSKKANSEIMNAVFYADLKKFSPICYLTRVLEVKEIPVMGAN